MTIEEKAKRYDKALDRAKEWLNIKEPFSDTCTCVVESIFPELQESEDERIKEVLVGWFKRYKEEDTIGSETFNGISTDSIIAWIEKQGEQKYIPKYKIGDYVKNTNYKGEPIYEIVYMDKECYICEYRGKERMGDKAVMHFAFDNPYLRLVEPKFKKD